MNTACRSVNLSRIPPAESLNGSLSNRTLALPARSTWLTTSAGFWGASAARTCQWATTSGSRRTR